MHRRVIVRGSLGLLLLAVGVGCGAVAPGDESSSSSSDSGSDASTGEPVVGWFDIGWGDTAFHELAEGGELKVVWGGQGAAMFPMPLRAAEFELPDDPNDYTSEKAPMLQLELDIDGHNDGIGGHFKRIANYPITFAVLPDGTYEYVYLAVLLPDALDPAALDGLSGHIKVELDPYGSAPMTLERDVVIADADPPPV